MFKPVTNGIYQHCGEPMTTDMFPLFAFHYKNCIRLGVGDMTRTGTVLAGIEARRLTYWRINLQDSV